MGSVNKVIIIGRLGADPEVRTTQSGVNVCNLRVATSESWKDNTGERQERTDWHRAVLWDNKNGGGMATIASKYLRKGSLVFLEGQNQTRKWQDSEGRSQYSTEVVLRPFNGTLTLLDKLPEPGSHEPDNNAGAVDIDDDVPW